MELVSMEMTKSEAQELYASPVGNESAPDETPKYPYGLKLDLDEEGLAKLKITELPKVGEKMVLTAQVEVCSVSQYESKEGGADQRVSLQITAMALEGGAKEAPAKADPAQTLYGSGS
jgi:hypothetical protein